MNQCENHPSCYETCTESDILVALVMELTFSPPVCCVSMKEKTCTLLRGM